MKNATRLTVLGATIALFALIHLVRSDGPEVSAERSGQAERIESPEGQANRAPSAAQAARDRDSSRSQQSGAPAATATEGPSDAEREVLASKLGIQHHGLLDHEAKTAIRVRLDRELAGLMKSLERMDPSVNQEKALGYLYAILKYQEAIRLLQRNDYLTIDLTILPSEVQGLDPMVLIGAATLDGKSISVLVPIRITPGGDLDALRQTAVDSEAREAELIVAEFNSQPAEERSQRIREMVAAREAIEEAARLRAAGRMTNNEYVNRIRDLAGKLPPRGTVVDPVTSTLRT